MGSAVEVYDETLAELYDYFIAYPMKKLHKAPHDIYGTGAGRLERHV
ncbi:hypothetical protein HC744_06070 [Arthrobacter sp. S1_S22]|nr:hypothetical protein [Arthrobacter sp. S1_S22]